MNDVLLNASLMLGAILVLAIPLYYVSKSSAKNKIEYLKNQFQDLCIDKGALISKNEIIGNLIWGHDEVKKVLLLLFIHGDKEEHFYLETEKLFECKVSSRITHETTAEVRLTYNNVNGNKHSIILYREFRDDEKCVKLLNEQANIICDILNRK